MVDYRGDNKWTVYVHIVPKEISGYEWDKRYIGITRQKPAKRWANGLGYQGQPFYNAVRKYGWNNMRHEIIAEVFDYNDALRLEEIYITLFKSSDIKYGYNCYVSRDKYKIKQKEYTPSDVALGNHSQATPVICLNTLEVFDCMVTAGIAYNVSHHHIGSCCRGKIKSIGRHPVTGEPLMWEFYDETKKYQIKEYETNSRGRKVVCLTTMELFFKVRDAEEKYNIIHRGIDRNCNGAKNLRGGAGKLEDGTLLQWQYYEDYLKQNNLTDEEARKSLFLIF